MGRITVYCVQSFWRAGPAKLARNDLRQFDSERRAREIGESEARRQGGAIVYSVSGSPEFDHWDPPRLIVALGDVPPLSL